MTCPICRRDPCPMTGKLPSSDPLTRREVEKLRIVLEDQRREDLEWQQNRRRQNTNHLDREE